VPGAADQDLEDDSPPADAKPPGYRVRHLTAADLCGLQALIGRCLAADGGLPDAASESLVRRQFLSGPGQAWLGPAGGLVAAAALGEQREGRTTAAGTVSPDSRGRGLGRELLDWTFAAAADAPLLVGTETLNPSAERLYARYGLRQVFAELIMRAPLPAPPAAPAATGPRGSADPPGSAEPAGIALLPWREDRVSDFYTAYAAAFGDRPGFPGWTEAEWADWTADDEDFRPELSLVAVDSDGTPAGFVTVSADCVVQAGVVPAWRRRGLGATLVRSAMGGLSRAGATDCWLTVATNNPGAIALYRRLGFADAGQRARYAR
jgi:mycothiol synthase